MKSEENEVSLIVEGDHLTSTKLGVVVKERSKHPSNRVTKPRREVVQNHFWLVGGGSTMALKGVCVCVGVWVCGCGK